MLMFSFPQPRKNQWCVKGSALHLINHTVISYNNFQLISCFMPGINTVRKRAITVIIWWEIRGIKATVILIFWGVVITECGIAEKLITTLERSLALFCFFPPQFLQVSSFPVVSECGHGGLDSPYVHPIKAWARGGMLGNTMGPLMRTIGGAERMKENETAKEGKKKKKGKDRKWTWCISRPEKLKCLWEQPIRLIPSSSPLPNLLHLNCYLLSCDCGWGAWKKLKGSETERQRPNHDWNQKYQRRQMTTLHDFLSS